MMECAFLHNCAMSSVTSLRVLDLRPLSNPWNSVSVEYLDEIPAAKLEVYEDHRVRTRTRR